MSKLKFINIESMYPSYSPKIGVNEIEGLKEALHSLVQPIQAAILEHVYWNDCEFTESEYTSRDGFIPHAHNCGGLELSLVIPKCESYEFDFLEFGECDECAAITELDEHGSPKLCGCDGQECTSEGEGHLDAKLRIWFKFEGLNDKGHMEFYLYMGGGNADAPYFRTKYEQTIFEHSFTAKTLADLKRKGADAVKKLLKELK